MDFQGPAFHCTCPVRRQPCKHSIGLLLLFSKNNDAFQAVDEAPDWVSSWLKKRDARRLASEKMQPVRSPQEEAALAEKRKQSREKRLYQMATGLSELENWLLDLFRQGLATLDGQAISFWNDLSARMVDARLGTLARRIRRLPLLINQEDWHEKMLAELGDIYLLVKAFQHLEQLPEPLQDDLLSLAGVNLKKEDLLTLTGRSDTWLVAGQTEEAEEGSLTARRSWLVGEKSERPALILDFSWGGQGYDANWKPGSVISAELVFYPSAYPQRALVKNFRLLEDKFELRNGFETLEAFASAYAEAISLNPWLSRFPAFLENLTPVFVKGSFALVDGQRKLLPILADEDLGWKMLALSGGRPMHIFGTWDGTAFSPLSAIVEGRFQLLQAPEKVEQPY